MVSFFSRTLQLQVRRVRLDIWKQGLVSIIFCSIGRSGTRTEVRHLVDCLGDVSDDAFLEADVQSQLRWSLLGVLNPWFELGKK